MAKFNSKLKQNLQGIVPNPNLVAANNIPAHDTVNKQGYNAYKLDKWIRLVTMLNTVKLQDQYYRTETETLSELKTLIDECATENKYLTAQCIVWSRCISTSGLRSVSHAASVFIQPYLKGCQWATSFYNLFNKQTKSGGVIFRPDDMTEIKALWYSLYGKAIAHSMKKGFKKALENLSSYLLLKYKNVLVDLFNLIRPNEKLSKATVEYNGEKIPTFKAIMKGYNVSADTHEVVQSEAGQEVAKAVKEGKITKDEAKEILVEAKSENWKQLLNEGKLGILALFRNLRNILNNKPESDTIDKVCKVISDGELIRKGKIMPYQIDLALEVMLSEFNDVDSRKIVMAGAKGYSTAVPNLSEILPGRTCVFVDVSGSMTTIVQDSHNKTNYRCSAADKACLIGATIAKATNGDLVTFDTRANFVNYSPNADVFTIAHGIFRSGGGTDLSCAWSLVSNRKYDRVFILSDNEANKGDASVTYKNYIRSCGEPYVYSIDLCAYGTTQVKGDKVHYLFGYSYEVFDLIQKIETNYGDYLEDIKKVVIDPKIHKQHYNK